MIELTLNEIAHQYLAKMEILFFLLQTKLVHLTSSKH